MLCIIYQLRGVRNVYGHARLYTWCGAVRQQEISFMLYRIPEKRAVCLFLTQVRHLRTMRLHSQRSAQLHLLRDQ